MPQTDGNDRGFVLFGVENPYFSDIVDTLRRADREITAGIITGEVKVGLSGVPVVLTPEEVSPLLLEHPIVTGQIAPASRHARTTRARELGFTDFPWLIDPSAVVAQSSDVARGCYVNALAVIASKSELAQFVFVGRCSSVGHHCRLEEFTTVGPGVTIASSCHIGRGAMIGAGATLLPRKTIGANSVIGAGAVVVDDVPDNTIVVGNPAKVIKTGIEGYTDRGI